MTPAEREKMERLRERFGLAHGERPYPRSVHHESAYWPLRMRGWRRWAIVWILVAGAAVGVWAVVYSLLTILGG